MKIHGFNKLTLLDYPGHTAAVLFLGHCNFRCLFCQNSSLVLFPDQEPDISKEEIFSFLKKRRERPPGFAKNAEIFKMPRKLGKSHCALGSHGVRCVTFLIFHLSRRMFP